MAEDKKKAAEQAEDLKTGETQGVSMESILKMMEEMNKELQETKKELKAAKEEAERLLKKLMRQKKRKN